MSIPLFITNKMKIKIKKLGYNDFLIKHMRPEEAHDILNGKLSVNNFINILNERLKI